MTCEEGPETVFSMFYPTYLLSFIIFTSKSFLDKDDGSLVRPKWEPLLEYAKNIQYPAINIPYDEFGF